MIDNSVLLHNGLFLRGKIFANALWCDLLRIKISQIVYKGLNKITVHLYFQEENIRK